MRTVDRDPPPLAHRDFRLLCFSAIFSGIGFRGQLVVLGWLLLESSDSPFIVGLGIGVMMAPNALFGVLGGAVADRADRRHLLRLISVGLSLNTLVLGVIVLNGAVIWVVLVLTFVGGSLWSVQQTARQSYAFDVVGSNRAVSGLALTNLAQRIGGVFGGLGTGLLITLWGPGEAYIGLSAAFLSAGLVILLARSKGQAAPIQRRPVSSNLVDYVAELRINPTLGMLIALTAAVEIFGFSHLSALPVLVRDELGRGGGTLGLVSAFSSAGGIVSILLLSTRGDVARKGMVFLGVLCFFGLALIFLGLSGNLTVVIVAVAIVSGLAALSDVLSQSLMQIAVPNEMRGRAMGSWAFATGIAPLGHLQIGALTAAIGVSTALFANGTGLVLLAVGAGIGVKTLRRL